MCSLLSVVLLAPPPPSVAADYQPIQQNHRSGKLYMVDLAGSENVRALVFVSAPLCSSCVIAIATVWLFLLSVALVGVAVACLL